MSSIVDAFQSQFPEGLIAVQGIGLSVSLPDLIGSRQRVGYYLEFDDIEKTVVTDFLDSSRLLDALTFEISRFSSAAFQTTGLVTSSIDDKEKIGWSLIQTYYAAFYAGHAILRICGQSCSYFNSSQINYIRQIGNASGRQPAFDLPASSYHCMLDGSSRKLTFRSLRDASGGAHEVFWAKFGLLLREIGQSTLRDGLDRERGRDTFLKFSEIEKNLRKHNASPFGQLSMTRNEIQYRHLHDVWLPNVMRRSDRQQLSRLHSQWTRDPEDIDLTSITLDPVTSLVATSIFIVSVCRSLLNRIAERSPSRSRSFATLGPLRLIA